MAVVKGGRCREEVVLERWSLWRGGCCREVVVVKRFSCGEVAVVKR